MANDVLISDELQIKNGDFLVGDSDQQNVEIIMNSNKGQFYQYPTLGVGIINQLSGPINRISLQKNIRIELESDNYNVTKVDIIKDSNGRLGIEIEASAR